MELLKDINNLIKLGEGASSTVYRDGDKAYKILKDSFDLRPAYTKKFIQKFDGIKNDLCVFPDDILEDSNGNLLGYIMDYVDGGSLTSAISNIPLDKLVQAIPKMKEQAIELARQGVFVSDLHSDNILWDNEKQEFRIIDTDFFNRVQGEIDPESINTNVNVISNSIISCMDNRIQQYCREENNQKIPLYDIRNNTPMSLEQYIEVLRSTMEKDFGKEFGTISEMEESLLAKQEEIEEKQFLEETEKEMTFKQRFIRSLANNNFLNKIPFVRSIIDRQVKMLPEAVKEIVENDNKKTEEKVAEEPVKEKTQEEKFRESLASGISLEEQAAFAKRRQEELNKQSKDEIDNNKDIED